ISQQKVGAGPQLWTSSSKESEMEHQRYTGVVSHLAKDRGYFFILYNGQKVFCHRSNWSEFEFPEVWDQVSFEVGPGHNNFPHQAINARPEHGLDADPLTVAGLAGAK